ncbi:hypothetical protein J5J10_14155 [Ciceribacter sp. L1K23]|uniref:hypothetical protein n=1 Tax=unclassified Ciceribacter TaxID=2628820 RepID=UPI001ABE4166|nr:MULTISPECIES: hypothetical protein [unclassified Ciceribacter]MBO3759026.1 hypothetical protein [Ciceribacter sp. L1K22]MBR0556827.1 hypothetical protein [Ciceribacter sp. L1K23]
MNAASVFPRSASIFRIDRFDCPRDSLAAFADRLALIHGYFDTLSGCLYNRVAIMEVEDRIEVVTVVEWENAASLRQAKAAVDAFYESTQFEPAAFLAENRIAGHFGVFQMMPL